MFLEDMTWEEIKQNLDKNTVAILVAGATEQHSLHLPVGTDTMVAYEWVKKTAEALEDKVKILVLPVLPFGRSPEEGHWTGTIYLKTDTYIKLIEDICESIIGYDIRRIIIYSGHGNNPPCLMESAKAMRDRYPEVLIGILHPWVLIKEDIKRLAKSKFWGHSCEVETSIVMHLFPEKIRQEKMRKPQLKGYTINKDRPMEEKIEGPLYISWRVEDFSDTGAFGNPTLATAEMGKILTETFVKKFGDLLIKFSQMKRRDVTQIEV